MGTLASFTPCTGDEPFLEGQPKLSLSLYPAELTFGNTSIGQSSNQSTILLRNEGTDTVAINEIMVVGDFEDNSDVIASIEASETVELKVSFKPTRVGVATGGLHIKSASAIGHKFVKLTGSGILVPSALPQFHQLMASASVPLDAVNIVGGVYALVGSGTFDGASLQLQWREDDTDPWADIPGAILAADNDAIFAIPLTTGQVRVVLAGGTASTSVSAQLAW